MLESRPKELECGVGISVRIKMCFPRYRQDRRKTLRATCCRDASGNHGANVLTVQLFWT